MGQLKFEMSIVYEQVRNKVRTQGLYGKFKPEGEDNVPDFYQPPQPKVSETESEMESATSSESCS